MKLLNDDCLNALKTFSDNSIDSVVTDPPYHLTSIVKRFGATNAAPAKFGKDGAFARASAGFMGQTWDGGDIAFRVELWSEIFRVLKPGGHVLAFSGTRTYHRMACAIEDAGFEIRDQIGWAYGSGFPKSRNIGNGWGTALKPAWEPICVARKPLIGTVAENVLTHGTGALNIDGCRVEGIKPQVTQGINSNATSFNVAKERRISGDPSEGRWPANLIHDGSDEVLAVFPDSSITGKRTEASRNATVEGTTWLNNNHKSQEYLDSGSAARFFYCAKTSKKERGEGNNHPTVKPIALMAYLCRLVTPPNGIVLDPFMGSGSTGIAAQNEGFDFIGIEREESYFKIASNRIEDHKKPSLKNLFEEE